MILAHNRLDKVDIKVLWILVTKLETSKYVVINRHELAAMLGVKILDFNHSIKRLIAEGILIERERGGRLGSYCLNDDYSCKESVKNHTEGLEEDRVSLEDRMKQSGIKSVIDGGKKYK